MATDPDTKKTIPFGESPTFVETYTEMEKLLADGRCKHIGVSNFSVKNLEILLPKVKVVPAVNQVESHIYLPQIGLDKYCQEKGIILTAYSPLGQPKPGQKSPVLAEPLVKKLAEKYQRPEGTILLSWIAQRPGWNVVPKSANPERMKANLDVSSTKGASRGLKADGQPLFRRSYAWTTRTISRSAASTPRMASCSTCVTIARVISCRPKSFLDGRLRTSGGSEWTRKEHEGGICHALQSARLRADA